MAFIKVTYQYKRDNTTRYGIQDTETGELYPFGGYGFSQRARDEVLGDSHKVPITEYTADPGFAINITPEGGQTNG